MASERTSEDSKLNYDERKKILFQKKTVVIENKVDPVMDGETVKEKAKHLSTVKQSMEVEYTEDGIRMAYGNLKKQRKGCEDRIKNLADKVKDAGEMTPELTKLKEDFALIMKIEEAEKSKAMVEAENKDLKEIKKNMKEIEDEIGSRLKL